MRKAVIDLGTNTFNLLIAEVLNGKLSILHSEKSGVALGMGGINKGIITTDAFQRAESALLHFKSKCDDWEVKSIQAIGTSALRDASNQMEFCQHMAEKIGIHIEIIDGDREAQLIFKGVKEVFDFKEKCLIVDIGGGSTEFILAGPNGVEDMESFDIGVSRIYQQFELNDPITLDDEQKIKAFLEQKISSRMDGWNPKILIGSSGSFETFYELAHLQSFPKSGRSIHFELMDLNRATQNMILSTLEERKRSEWIIPIRQRMMPITSVKVRWILQKFNIQQVYLSPFSLKEGALFD